MPQPPWDNTTSMPSWDDVLDVREENERQGGQVVWTAHEPRDIEYLIPTRTGFMGRFSHRKAEFETCGCGEEAQVAIKVEDSKPLQTLCIICDALHLTPRFGGLDLLDPPEPPRAPA
jgi:hypothetical protein